VYLDTPVPLVVPEDPEHLVFLFHLEDLVLLEDLALPEDLQNLGFLDNLELLAVLLDLEGLLLPVDH
jgi:hypothetical protein